MIYIFVAGATIITIKKIFGSPGEVPLINLAEVQLFSKGVQIPTSQLSFTLSSIYGNAYASYCNNGNLYDYCHSGSGDSNPTLTISSPIIPDKIVVYNRVDCCQFRIDGATISMRLSGGQLWSRNFVGSQTSYTYFPGNNNMYT